VIGGHVLKLYFSALCVSGVQTIFCCFLLVLGLVSTSHARVVTPMPVDELNGTTSWQFVAGELQRISRIGDINDDGFSDLAFGVGQRVVVVFGKGNGFEQVTDLDRLPSADGFTITNASLTTEFGKAIAGVGDVNGDGIDDFMVGAPGKRFGNFSSQHPGAAYLIYGRRIPWSGSLEVTAMTDTDGLVVTGAATDGGLGEKVGGLGDINGDGIRDYAVFGSTQINDDAGYDSVYVVYGTLQNRASPLDVTNLATRGYEIYVARFFELEEIRSVGDINNDGISDFSLQTSTFAFGNLTTDRGYIVYGSSRLPEMPVDIRALAPDQGLSFDGVGSFFRGPGDVNGDGIDDLLIYLPNYLGRFLGPTLVFGPVATNFDGRNFNSEETVNLSNTTFGSSYFNYNGDYGFPTNIGDFNGDGLQDIAVGDHYFNSQTLYGYQPPGRLAVFFGARTKQDFPWFPFQLGGDTGFQLVATGNTGELSSQIEGAGDVNGDGFDDLVTGFIPAENGQRRKAIVVFGFNSDIPKRRLICGEAYASGRSGYSIWQDCPEGVPDGRWHFRVSGNFTPCIIGPCFDGGFAPYLSQLQTDGQLREIEAFDIDADDRIRMPDASTLSLQGTYHTNRTNVDGVDFTLENATKLCVNTGAQVGAIVGANRWQYAENSIDILSGESCVIDTAPVPDPRLCGRPRLPNARIRGIYIWRDCTSDPDDTWHILLGSGGRNEVLRKDGNIVFSGEMEMQTENVEDSDVFRRSGANQVDYTLRVIGTGYDKISLKGDSRQVVCFSQRTRPVPIDDRSANASAIGGGAADDEITVRLGSGFVWSGAQPLNLTNPGAPCPNPVPIE